jgi:hypothetical protein
MAHTRTVLGRSKLLAAGMLAAVTLVGAGGAAEAQQSSAGCGAVQGILLQRKSLTDKLHVRKGEKLDAKVACSTFTQLVSNGQNLVKWIDANKDWCQIPDSFAQGIKADHSRAVTIRGQACNVAAKQAQMEKQARDGGGGGGGGLLGGGGLEGPMSLPKGAL